MTTDNETGLAYIHRSKILAPMAKNRNSPEPIQLIKLTAVVDFVGNDKPADFKVQWKEITNGMFAYYELSPNGGVQGLGDKPLTSINSLNQSFIWVAAYISDDGYGGRIDRVSAQLYSPTNQTMYGYQKTAYIAFCTPHRDGWNDMDSSNPPPQPNIVTEDDAIKIPPFTFNDLPPTQYDTSSTNVSLSRYTGGYWLAMKAVGPNAIAGPTAIYEAIGDVASYSPGTLTFPYWYDEMGTDASNNYDSPVNYTYMITGPNGEFANGIVNNVRAEGDAWLAPNKDGTTYDLDYVAPLWHQVGSDGKDEDHPQGFLTTQYPTPINQGAFDSGNLVMAIPCQVIKQGADFGKVLIEDEDIVTLTVYFNAWHAANSTDNRFKLTFPPYMGSDGQTGFANLDDPSQEWKDLKFIKVSISQDRSNPPLRDLMGIEHNGSYLGFFYAQYVVTKYGGDEGDELDIHYSQPVGLPTSGGTADVRLEIPPAPKTLVSEDEKS
ncbi:hypothetical protein [Brucella sp. IR073]|uniref:hypothetical protein n=1 Tax=unclassified Brucella TaxID=2632610 RepID=UPI003B981C50